MGEERVCKLCGKKIEDGVLSVVVPKGPGAGNAYHYFTCPEGV